MRISFFTDTYFPNLDGVVVAIQNYRRELERRGHEIEVFAAGSAEAARLNEDPHVHFFEGFSFPSYPQYKIAFNPFAAKKIVRDRGFDLVHCHAMASMGFAAIKTARDLRLPLVGTFHTLLPAGTHYITHNKRGQEIISRIAWHSIKHFYKPFDVVTAPSKVIVEMLAEHGVDEDKLRVVPNGIDLKSFRCKHDHAKARKALGFRARDKVVLFAGRVTEEKHVDLIVRSAKQVIRSVPSVKFLIVGDGPFKSTVEVLVAENGLNDRFVFKGAVPHSRMPFFFSVADVNVCPSTFDTYGLSIVEGMACGVPCVGARAYAIPEIVRDGCNGFLFEPNNPKDFADKLTRLLLMSSRQARKMREQAVATARLHSLSKAVDLLEGVYESVSRKKFF
ncbi:MAG: glycosyltransferase [Candidatus Micrarchaeia archaeon]